MTIDNSFEGLTSATPDIDTPGYRAGAYIGRELVSLGQFESVDDIAVKIDGLFLNPVHVGEVLIRSYQDDETYRVGVIQGASNAFAERGDHV